MLSVPVTGWMTQAVNHWALLISCLLLLHHYILLWHRPPPASPPQHLDGTVTMATITPLPGAPLVIGRYLAACHVGGVVEQVRYLPVCLSCTCPRCVAGCFTCCWWCVCSEQRECVSCWTSSAPLWTRDSAGRHLCNTCSLQQKTNDRPLLRPKRRAVRLLMLHQTSNTHTAQFVLTQL